MASHGGIAGIESTEEKSGLDVPSLTYGHASSAKVIEEFVYRTRNDPLFDRLLTASLVKAQKTAKGQLEPALFYTLLWPQSLNTYIGYLIAFASWNPQQSLSPAWINPDGLQDQTQEVFDRLCHFYYLIDQPVGDHESMVIQNYPWFAKWLADYATSWGDYLDTPQSFNNIILEGFINDSYLQNQTNYRLMDSMMPLDPSVPRDVWPPKDPSCWRSNAASGWISFNQFFSRELNPGLRPIENPFQNACITSPADCTYKDTYHINADGGICTGDGSAAQIVLKKTHKIGTVQQLLEGSQYADSFGNGTFVHYFLGPYSYHRFHAPVAGRVVESLTINAKVYLKVQIDGDGQFDAPDSSEDGYEFYQSRGIITIDTTESGYGNVGVVAVIPIGMALVDGVNMTALPRAPGAEVGGDLLKGDEFGYFTFGSDIILLFQEQANAQIVPTGDNYVHYGNEIAQCTPM